MSDEKEAPIVVMVHQTLLGSVLSDLATFAMICAVFGIGLWAQSSAMQWMGFFMIIIMMLSRRSSKIKRMKPQEAANYLQDTFQVVAQKTRATP